VRLAGLLLVLLLTACSSSSDSSTPPDTAAPVSWIGMVPGDARPFEGPSGELVLIYVDETYSVDGINASALTWKLGDAYTTDFFDQRDDGSVWWYGRRGLWRAGRHGEEPREVPIVDHTATFGDRVITLGDDGGPVRLETPEGVFTS
jgi:hypothetical protein